LQWSVITGRTSSLSVPPSPSRRRVGSALGSARLCGQALRRATGSPGCLVVGCRLAACPNSSGRASSQLRVPLRGEGGLTSCGRCLRLARPGPGFFVLLADAGCDASGGATNQSPQYLGYSCRCHDLAMGVLPASGCCGPRQELASTRSWMSRRCRCL
jgi:hypothetical protein